MKIGFIGYGNMASAMVQGMIKSQRYAAEDITVTARNYEGLKTKAEKLKINFSTDNIQVASQSDILFLSVKPYLYKQIIEEIRDYVNVATVIVTVAAGISTRDVAELFGREVKVVRTIPNTPALVNQAMTLYFPNDLVTDEETRAVRRILESFGRAELIGEKQFDGPGSMTGCSPAFIFMLMEAMADAAVLEGLERKKAYLLAAQTVKGAAEMLLTSGLHPGELKDMVTSPGGTTIEGVRKLEELGFRSAMIEAIEAAANKTRSLSRKPKPEEGK